MLRIEKLTYRIGRRILLDGAEAAINPGHRVGLVGRNGAGKTTVLRLITGQCQLIESGPWRRTAHLSASETRRTGQARHRGTTGDQGEGGQGGHHAAHLAVSNAGSRGVSAAWFT